MRKSKTNITIYDSEYARYVIFLLCLDVVDYYCCHFTHIAIDVGL